jgi:hypothetical protein
MISSYVSSSMSTVVMVSSTSPRIMFKCWSYACWWWCRGRVEFFFLEPRARRASPSGRTRAFAPGPFSPTHVQPPAQLPLAAHLDVDALVQRQADEVERLGHRRLVRRGRCCQCVRHRHPAPGNPLSLSRACASLSVSVVARVRTLYVLWFCRPSCACVVLACARVAGLREEGKLASSCPLLPLLPPSPRLLLSPGSLSPHTTPPDPRAIKLHAAPTPHRQRASEITWPTPLFPAAVGLLPPPSLHTHARKSRETKPSPRPVPRHDGVFGGRPQALGESGCSVSCANSARLVVLARVALAESGFGNEEERQKPTRGLGNLSHAAAHHPTTTNTAATNTPHRSRSRAGQSASRSTTRTR